MKTIDQATIEELKALAYDELAKIEQSQKMLNLLNQEILKKIQEPTKEKEVKETKSK